MNPLLERQKIPCPICAGEGMLHGKLIGKNTTIFNERCYKCGGRKTVFESHESYEARLVRMIEILTKWCVEHKIGWEGTEKERNAWIRDAFNAAKEKENG